MPRFGISGGPRLGRQVAAGAGIAGPARNLNYRQSDKYSSFTYRWNGAQFVDSVNRGTARGFSRISLEAEREWVQIVHVIEGHLRDSANFIVDIDRHGRVTLIFQNTASYADFEERGTIHREGHFPMRQTMDRVVPRIPGILADAYHVEGLGRG